MANKMNSSAILASLSPQEILDFQVRNGMIDLDDVRASIVDTERKKILKSHPYAISHGKDGRWRTWVPDKNAKDGRKKIAKSTREKIEEAVICYYLENDEELKRKRMTLRDLYPEWLEYKKLLKGKIFSRYPGSIHAFGKMYISHGIAKTAKVIFFTDMFGNRVIDFFGQHGKPVMIVDQVVKFQIQTPFFVQTLHYHRMRKQGMREKPLQIGRFWVYYLIS